MQNSPGGDEMIDTALCPRAEEAAACRRGELAPAERSAFEQHCRECPTCRTLLADFERVEEVIQSRPAARLDAEFASRVLARLHAEPQDAPPLRTWHPGWRGIFKLAASLALCAGALAFWWRLQNRGEMPPSAGTARSIEAQAIGEALDWLAHTQEKSGAWDVAKWQGDKEYEVGLTGMALLAFMKEPGRKETYAGAIGKALDYLVRQQDARGAIGPLCSGRMYNHGIATVAMLEAYGKTGNQELREPIARAIRFILDQQLDSGGWGYENRVGQQANTSISFWQLQALQLANAAKIGDTAIACRRGLRWLGGVIDGNGLVGYQAKGDFPQGSETLTAMGAVCLGAARPVAGGAPPEARLVQRALQSVTARMDAPTDFYRCFFLARAARAAGGRQFEQPLARLRQSLVAMRSTTGSAAGSWEPVGAWSPVGGRVFSTAMATLSLQAGRTGTDAL